MAEAFLNYYGKDVFEAESAGLEPGKINRNVVTVMKEKGIDISENNTNSVFEFLKAGKNYNYVITVCDETNGEKCPIFRGTSHRLHWSFDDPSALNGSKDFILARLRVIRDEIEAKIREFFL